ncbi:MAG: permease [Prolixibacteraceae bacterium]|jgi:uncharacterized membrane protein YraQ (UPF0718 family)/copper chaperone CopZ|nr:permease [Prolixibacteraceae bacterium]
MNYIVDFLNELWWLMVEMSPYLLFGFLFAGILHIYLQKDKVGKMLNGNNLRSVTNATILGIPLPLCSCGVIPAGLSFHKNGASKGSTVSFLISTPQTGVDSVLVTYSLLGLPFALIRPFVAMVTGIAGGLFANSLTKEHVVKKEKIVDVYADYTFLQKVRTAFKYGFVDFIQDISKWLIIGLLLAALLAVVIPDDFFTEYVEYPWLNMLLVLAASVPLYICATGSVPVAAVLMMKGLSPGAALVFLMAGPATNIATLTVLAKSIGKKATFVYLMTIVVGAIIFGVLIDTLLPAQWFAIDTHIHAHNHIIPEWLGVVSAVLLGVLILNGYILNWIKARKEKMKITKIADTMGVQKFKVEGMTCKNCKAHVEKGVIKINGVNEAVADFSKDELLVYGDNINIKEIEKSVEDAGYMFRGAKQ